MLKIVLATSNVKKLAEFAAYLKNYPIELIPQFQLNVPEVEETGLSFVENALIKARHAARHTHLPAIADDSGLVVPALKGAPGIYSARYAGKEASDEQNILKLLQAMADLPNVQRQASFQCAVVFVAHANDPVPIIAEGSWQGQILNSPQGKQGFGYDPIFYVPTHQCSAAELSIEEKNRISHRGHAITQLCQRLIINEDL